MTNSKIPFLDLVAPHEELKEELLAVFADALRNAAFVGGPMVEGFERDFAAFCGTGHCVGVASGTDAVRFALMAAGLKKGSIVVTVPNTFIATTEAITQATLRPDFVDIDERTYNMDPEKLREYLEVQCFVDKTSGELVNRKSGLPVAAVVPVHLYGQTADMDPILDLAARYHLVVIEDACQAHGAEYFSASGQPLAGAHFPVPNRDREGAVLPEGAASRGGKPTEGRWRKAGSMGKAPAPTGGSTSW